MSMTFDVAHGDTSRSTAMLWRFLLNYRSVKPMFRIRKNFLWIHIGLYGS